MESRAEVFRGVYGFLGVHRERHLAASTAQGICGVDVPLCVGTPQFVLVCICIHHYHHAYLIPRLYQDANAVIYGR
jgi:hypothetical protein